MVPQNYGTSTLGEGRTLEVIPTAVYGVAFSPDGKYALTSSLDETAKLWEIGTGKEILTFSGHNALVSSVNFSPDAKYILTGGNDGVAQVWEIATGQSVHTFSELTI